MCIRVGTCELKKPSWNRVRAECFRENREKNEKDEEKESTHFCTVILFVCCYLVHFFLVFFFLVNMEGKVCVYCCSVQWNHDVTHKMWRSRINRKIVMQCRRLFAWRYEWDFYQSFLSILKCRRNDLRNTFRFSVCVNCFDYCARLEVIRAG